MVQTATAGGPSDSIDSYIAAFPADAQAVLTRIRTLIRAAAPDAEETISYKIPTFKRHGSYLVYFAGYKKHVSIYPILSESSEFADELAPYRSGAGTAKFPLDQPIPFDLIDKIVRFMALENAKRARKKNGASPA